VVWTVLRRLRPGLPGLTVVSALLRVVVGAGLLWVALFVRARVDYAPLMIAASSFAAFVLLPRETVTEPGCGSGFQTLARTFLAYVAVTEFLWVYPVAGSQVAFATYLGVAAAAVCVSDGLSALADRDVPAWIGRGTIALLSRLVTVLIPAALAVFSMFWLVAAGYQYDRAVPLRLPGANRVHLPEWQANDLKGLTLALRQRGTTFLTLPGLYSLHLWTGIDPPTDLNISNWICKLSDDEQERVIAIASRQQGLCAVLAPEALKFWEWGIENPEQVERRPLVRYIRTSFEPTATFGWYTLLER